MSSAVMVPQPTKEKTPMKSLKPADTPATDLAKAVELAAACIESLERQRDEATATLARIRAAREPLALPAKTGDAKAQAELDRLADQERKAERELNDLHIAIATALTRHQAAKAAVERADLAKRRSEAERLAGELLKQSRMIDEGAAIMASAFEARRQLITAITRTGAVPMGSLNRLSHRIRANHAVLWRLRQFIEAPWIRSVDIGGSLEAMDQGQLAALMMPAAPEKKAA